MKLNENIEEYDVKSIQSILHSVTDIKNSCKKLENGAVSLEHNIGMFEKSFDSENMSRAKEIIKKFVARLSDAERELGELLGSVNDYAEKLKRAWRPW